MPLEMSTESEQAIVRRCGRWLARKMNVPFEKAISLAQGELLHEFRYCLAMLVRAEIRLLSRKQDGLDIANYCDIEEAVLRRLEKDPSLIDPLRMEQHVDALNKRLDAQADHDEHTGEPARKKAEIIKQYARRHGVGWDQAKAAVFGG